MKNKYIHLLLVVVISSLGLISIFSDRASAADAGCYKVESGELSKITCPPSPPAVYDDANGANILRPSPSKCYIYSENLYDGDSSWGEPYVEVPCDTLSSCPEGQELRYSDSVVGPPVCVAVDAETGGTFAGGAQPPRADGVSRDELSDGKCEPEGDEGLNSTNCGIIRIVVNVINFLSAVAGIALVASLMISGYLYMTARDNAGQIEKAKSRIIQTLLALALFIFMYALLNFLIPGGLGLA